ncbi:hypothetical protein K1719_026355 [Acacia pycnantha]|nr:hypothetical protein K1719_026355 [Acacia pycnantha]
MDRVAWDDEATQVLLDDCINQINAREREGKGKGNVKKYSNQVWDYIVSTFNKTSKQCKRSHLKNRLDVLRKVYKDWVRLLNEPGAEDNAYRKFRHDGLNLGEAMRRFSRKWGQLQRL